jgi:hypothetical protein
MSGIITGPHFIKFFGGPDAIQVGTMVAVLEIGAFGVYLISMSTIQSNESFHRSDVNCRRPSGRHYWEEGNTFCRCSCVHFRGRCANIHRWVLVHGFWARC